VATEPISAGSSAFIITGAAAALLGPVLGPAVLMAFSAVIGSLLALGGVKTESKWDAVRFTAVAVGLSLALTGTGVWLVEHFTPLPGSLAIMPVAFCFAAARNLIIDFIGKLLDVVVSIVGRKGGA